MEKENNPLKALRRSVIDVLVQDAGNGNTHAAHALLKEIVADLKAGTPLPQHVANWLANAISEVLKDPENSGKALGLVNPAGNPGYSTEFLELVAEAHHERTGGKKGVFSDGYNRKGEPYALTATAEIFGINADTVKEAYKKHLGTVLERRRVNRELREEHGNE